MGLLLLIGEDLESLLKNDYFYIFYSI